MKNCNKKVVSFLIAFLMLISVSGSAFAQKLASVSYNNVGTSYQWRKSVVADKSGLKFSVNTRPTSTQTARLKIYSNQATYAVGDFPYQVSRSAISTSMKKMYCILLG